MESMGAVPSSEVLAPKPGESGIEQKAEAGSYFIRLLQQRLDDLQPEKVSPRWIELTDNVLFKELSREARTPDGIVDWQRVVNHLSPQWQAAWKRGEAGQTKSNEAKRVRPRRWLDPQLQAIMQEPSGEPPTIKRKSEKPRNLGECVDRLIVLLESKNPDILNPTWIQKNSGRLYLALTNFIRDEQGAIQWFRLKELLPSVWRTKWKEKSRLEDYLPSKEYADQNEVDEAIAPYKDNLYSFASLDWERPSIDHELQKQLKRMAEKGSALAQKRLAELQIKPQDIKKMRNDVSKALIGLARKGNTSAVEKLSELVEPLVQGWLDKEDDLSVYKHDPEKLQKIFERCIYLYAEKGEFLDYLRSSLALQAKGIRHQEARSLDAEMGESGQNLLDRLGTYQEPNLEEEEEEDQEQEVYTFGKKSGPTVKAA